MTDKHFADGARVAPVKNFMATIGAGLVLAGAYLGFESVRHELGRWEAARFPVLAEVTVCRGEVDKSTGSCAGELVHYEGFAQTASSCDGRDAIVSGTMSKVRQDARYIEGAQGVFFGDPNGPFRRAFFEFEDQQNGTPTNRPKGVQDWGPWRLVGGCVSSYTSWFTTVEHRPWHGLWPLATTSGPFPLPRAQVVYVPPDDNAD